jgi:imidazolonepropionase-like amidohydrolase
MRQPAVESHSTAGFFTPIDGPSVRGVQGRQAPRSRRLVHSPQQPPARRSAPHFDTVGIPAGYRADLAIDNGRITRIGDLADASAARVIDATNRIVTPGFVDLHTHLDAQVGWDPLLRSSCYHGVTTALIGNCGVTFADRKSTRLNSSHQCGPS